MIQNFYMRTLKEYCQELGLKNIALRSHQLEGLKWLSECHERGQHGCILGDEMGLGKTLQSIALLLYLRDASSSPSPPFIVICPLSVVSGWEKELQRASPQLRVLNFCGDKETRGSKQEEILLHCYKSGAMIDPPFDILLVHYE
ncbi:PREDICTED: chromodomain-helicase-DNA-binding protein 1-like, partial [Amphimedon queenslandica]|uniref:SNF2 N-terminal domain-containing protein n=2 Tax=Amphimedon queenslandica TaxID=400682 RepID=A0AAN0JT55_AMPQE